MLFNNAEEAGLIEGHTPFKTGIKTLRKSQQIGLETASISSPMAAGGHPLLPPPPLTKNVGQDAQTKKLDEKGTGNTRI